MQQFFLYLLKVCICSALFYGTYYFLLKRLTFFAWNRYYLLGSLVLSLCVPVLQVDITRPQEQNALTDLIYSSSYIAAGIENLPARLPSAGTFSFDWWALVVYVYLTGAAWFLLRFIVSLAIILRLQRRAPLQVLGNIRIVKGSRLVNNCSFWNTIFLDPALLTPEDQAQVIMHEKCHIKLKHSFDKVFVQLMQALLWFNPFIYLYKRSLDTINEFQADAFTVKKTDRVRYMDMLLRLSTGKTVSLINHFNKSFLRERLELLLSARSARFKKIYYGAGLCVLILMVVLFGLNRIPLQIRDIPRINAAGNRTAPHKAGEGSNAAADVAAGVARTKPAPPVKKDSTLQPAPATIPDEPQASAGTNTPEDDALTVPVVSVNDFVLRETVTGKNGYQYDTILLRFGKYYLTLNVEKDGKVLYLINGKSYEEQDIKKFTNAEISSLKCPCGVKTSDSLMYGKYYGIVRIGGSEPLR